jgi:hypothetical protein
MEDYDFESKWTPNDEAMPHVIHTEHLYAMIFMVNGGPTWRSEIYSKKTERMIFVKDYEGFDLADIATQNCPAPSVWASDLRFL